MNFEKEFKLAMKQDFFTITDRKDDEKELRSLLQTNKPKKLLFKNQENVYLIELIPDTDDLNYYPCKEVSADIHVNEAMILLEKHRFIVLKEKKNYIGYLSTFDLFKLLRNEYKQLNAYYQAILETIDGSCTVIDANQNVLVWTKGAEKLFSVKQKDIIGKPITDFFSPERLELLNTLKNGDSLQHKQHKAREDLVVLINSNPVYLEDQIIGAVVSEIDITSQIRLNNELNNASEKLFELERETNRFIPSDPFKLIRGNSKTLKKTTSMAEKAASTSTNILIHGESGVGKELFAKAIHTIREGNKAPFIAINCGAIPSSLFESEMFGYEKGAFSGADNKGKKGKVELAQGGTLFLDEIGEMPLEMQVKLLRLLQEKKFYAVGGTKEKTVDFRVIAATNRILKDLVEEGKFREDLYYRLNVVSLEIPPLRKRPEDIIELTHYFLYEISIKYNRPIYGISQEVMQALLNHEWQGNIRELKNVIERLIVFSEDGQVKLEHLPFEIDGLAVKNNSMTSIYKNDSRPLADRLQEVERKILLHELDNESGNKNAVARKLQITRATLYNRLNKLGIKN